MKDGRNGKLLAQGKKFFLSIGDRFEQDTCIGYGYRCIARHDFTSHDDNRICTSVWASKRNSWTEVTFKFRRESWEIPY